LSHSLPGASFARIKRLADNMLAGRWLKKDDGEATDREEGA
jgi:hypothetical protein